MNLKKLMAGTLTMTMVIGSSATVFAADANGATGTGTAFDHVDKEVTSVTLPTDTDVANVFNYYVDPERAINGAGTLTDGSAVTANTDGVYFAHAGQATPAKNAEVLSFSIGGKTEADTDVSVTIPNNTTVTGVTYESTSGQWQDDGGAEVTGISVTGATPTEGDTITIKPYEAGGQAGATTYDSKSEEVAFSGKNSVDVDVSVEAAVAASAGGKDIALVADDAALTAAEDPALLMTLKVGNESKAITTDGVTATATIVGKPNNFEITADTANNKYVYDVKADTTALEAWGETSVQLIGKTNQKDIPSGMTAPKINLTWTVKKSEKAKSYLSSTTMTSASPSVTATLPEGVTLSKIELLKSGATTPVTMIAGSHYTVSGSTYTFKSDMVSKWSGAKLTFTYSDKTSEVVTVQ